MPERPPLPDQSGPQWPKAIVQDAADHMAPVGPNGSIANLNAAAKVIRALLDAGYRIVRDPDA